MRLLLYPPGLEFIAAFFGALYAGVIAIPAYPPLPARVSRALPKLAHLASDADVRVILTSTPLKNTIESALTKSTAFHELRCLATDAIEGPAPEYSVPDVDPNAVAVLQYTSGSTAQPRGVKLSHANLVHNSARIYDRFRHSSNSVGVSWLPPYHDMGLIGGVLQPVFGGFPLTLLSPFAFLQRPFRWLQAISNVRASGSGGPNFAYDLCVRKITAEQRASLDLSSWQVAFSGAEPVRAETIRRFTEAFAPCGFRPTSFYPCYGLAEATLLVSGGTLGEPPLCRSFLVSGLQQRRAAAADYVSPEARELVGLGRSIAEQPIVIVDPESRTRCPEGGIGEIWVSGQSVAKGYWKRPEESSRIFHASLVDTGEGPFLRTGDLGFLWQGQLFVTGRMQDLIVIRGRNHFAEDIEITVQESHAAIRPSSSAAFSADLDGREQLITMVETDPRSGIEPTEVETAIRCSVSEVHGLAIHSVVFLAPGLIPKTTSGKVQRHLCRAEFVKGMERTPSIADQPDTANPERCLPC